MVSGILPTNNEIEAIIKVFMSLEKSESLLKETTEKGYK